MSLYGAKTGFITIVVAAARISPAVTAQCGARVANPGSRHRSRGRYLPQFPLLPPPDGSSRPVASRDDRLLQMPPGTGLRLCRTSI